MEKITSTRVTQEGVRQTLRWQWYLSEAELDALTAGEDEQFNVQLRLAKQTLEQIADFKRRGSMVDEYA